MKIPRLDLLDAVPYLRAYAGQIFVVKVGGELLLDPTHRDCVARTWRSCIAWASRRFSYMVGAPTGRGPGAGGHRDRASGRSADHLPGGHRRGGSGMAGTLFGPGSRPSAQGESAIGSQGPMGACFRLRGDRGHDH